MKKGYYYRSIAERVKIMDELWWNTFPVDVNLISSILTVVLVSSLAITTFFVSSHLELKKEE